MFDKKKEEVKSDAKVTETKDVQAVEVSKEKPKEVMVEKPKVSSEKRAIVDICSYDNTGQLLLKYVANCNQALAEYLCDRVLQWDKLNKSRIVEGKRIIENKKKPEEESKEEKVARLMEERALKFRIFWDIDKDTMQIGWLENCHINQVKSVCHRVLAQSMSLRMARQTVMLYEKVQDNKNKKSRIHVPGA